MCVVKEDGSAFGHCFLGSELTTCFRPVLNPNQWMFDGGLKCNLIFSKGGLRKMVQGVAKTLVLCGSVIMRSNLIRWVDEHVRNRIQRGDSSGVRLPEVSADVT